MNLAATPIKLTRLAALGLVLAVMLAGQAWATIGTVTGTPNPLRINVVAPQTLSVTWRVQVFTGIPVTISSATGQIFIDGAPVAAVNGAISRPATANGTVVFRETIRISRALARRIGAGGAVDYRRDFIETPPGGPATTGTVAVRPTQQGTLAIRDLDIRFDDDSQYRVVQLNDRVIARAEISSIGSGVLEGRWEHAGPGALSAGEAVFQPLQRTRQPLGGSRRLVLTSPPLPTNIAGLHIVRFRPVRLDRREIQDPRDLVELRYVVQLGRGSESIALLSPDEEMVLTPSTRFAWQPAPGAAYHRLEFLGEGTTPVDNPARRLAAVDLPGGGGSARLRPFTLNRLSGAPGRVYWRIVAFDGAGNPIAQSPLRKLRRAPLATPTDR